VCALTSFLTMGMVRKERVKKKIVLVWRNAGVVCERLEGLKAQTLHEEMVATGTGGAKTSCNLGVRRNSHLPIKSLKAAFSSSNVKVRIECSQA
jgi:hypothetical protein